ncbi:DivIVA domain-containing protein [Calidifontibacter indicus]|uniref:DivIVA domain-containing protein n=1 Tax=Calidifontibacter indicus TaxID=419650 RepID=A0A3D9UP36_9MICO|nr:DivIVA domain-containing protein [Calidifontibacter indicus]
MPWTQDHVTTVRKARLSKQRGGYQCDDVDRYLEHAVALMRAGREVPAAPVTGLRRSTWREGYSTDAVEALFSHIAGWQADLLADTGSQATTTGVLAPKRMYWTPQQLDWVRESNFRPARGKRGYAEDEVDSFLDTVLIAMTKGEELPDIDTVRFFPPRVGRTGYEALAVDKFLDDLKRLRPILR